MTYARIDLSSAMALRDAVEDIDLVLSGLTFAGSEQLALPIPGIDQALDEHMAERDVHLQAIDAFMEERNDLKAELTVTERLADVATDRLRFVMQERDMMAEGARIVGAENAQLREENDALAQALTRNSLWMLQVREGLARLGITIDTNELDQPALSIDLPALAGSIESFVGLPG